MQIPERLQALRAQMRARKLHAYLIPSGDPHLSEYVPQCWQRRTFISGFTGSAGDVLVTLDRVGLWTDGRYYLQAERELSGTGIELFRAGTPGVPDINSFLRERLEPDDRVGADPQVLSVARAAALESALAACGARLKLLSTNLVDVIWKERAPMPRAALRVQPARYAGQSLSRKLRRVREAMRRLGCDAHVVSELDAIMWTLNVRGRDVDFNPVAISYLIVEDDSATLYIDPTKISGPVERHLARHVQVRPYGDIAKALRAHGQARKRVWVDADASSRWIVERLRGATVHRAPSCIGAMKACKNPAEQAGMRSAHVRDGVAMVKFLKWLDDGMARAEITEMSAAARLEALRAEGELFQGLSFNTISGYAEHGAIIHYAVDDSTDVLLRPRGLYLLDSGAQYLDGTTDITRTLCLGGRPTSDQKEQYTRVLMGHIDLARARFPPGTRGLRLDTLARMHLWQAGLDYRHGTGHGVGAHLNVHEGPQSISPRCSGAALEAGNVLSNEPGYYEDGSHGIRIENLLLVVKDESVSTDGHDWLAFETLTLCPIDTSLIKVPLLYETHRAWLNAYHRRVKAALSPLLDREHRAWLRDRCAPL